MKEIIYKTIKGKKRNSRRAMLLSSLVPGWGQWYNGEKKKGILLILLTLIVGLGLISHGVVLAVAPSVVSSEEEIEMTEEGIVIEAPQAKEPREEKGLFLPVTLILLGLVIFTATGLYGIKDTRKFWLDLTKVKP